MCSSSTKPERFCISGNWLVRTRGPLGIPTEKRYVICRTHIERIIDNITLSICQEVYANDNCLNSQKYFDQYRINKRPSCFYFYQEDLITLSDFCIECKINFVSSSDFNLKRIKIDNNGI